MKKRRLKKKPLYRKVKYNDIITPIKNKLISYSGVSFGTTGTDINANILSMSLGTSNGERLGYEIKLTNVILSGVAYLTPGETDNITIRVSLGMSKQTDPGNNFSSTWIDYPPGGDVGLRIHYTKKPERWKQFTFLYDKFLKIDSKHSFDIEIDGTTYTISNGGSVAYRCCIELNEIIKYSETGTIPQNTNLVLFIHSDQNATKILPPPQDLVTTGYIELHYEDF